LKRLVWLEADIVVTGAGTTWGNIAPDPDKWEPDVGATTRTWSEIFNIDAAPIVNITLAWDDNSTADFNDYSNYAYNLEILTAVTNGRYYRVMIEITDPSDAINAIVENYSLYFYTQA